MLRQGLGFRRGDGLPVGQQARPGRQAQANFAQEAGEGRLLGAIHLGAVEGQDSDFGGAVDGDGRGWVGRRAERGRDAVGFAQRHAARGHDLRHCVILAVNQD